MNNKLIVLFPGVNYNCDCPLLYYAGFKYEVKDYKKICINYNLDDADRTSYEECMKVIKSDVKKQLDHIDFGKYEEIVFISKSIGTIAACWIQDELHLNVKHIFITPLDKSTQYIKNDRNISWVITGSKDKKINQDMLKKVCHEQGIRLHVINGVGHRLEKVGDMKDNIDILKQVIELI